MSAALGFCDSLGPGRRILELPGWFVWCCAPIYDSAGLLHLFFTRWPASAGMNGWRDHSEIVHATAPTPAGPYSIRGALFERGPGDWDLSMFNPNVHRVDSSYVLVYAGRAPGDDPFEMAIGMALADDLSGPWRRWGKGPIIAPSRQSGAWDAIHASNPSFVACGDGDFRIYYKGIGESLPRLRTIGVAVARQVDGPYRGDPRNPLIDYRPDGGDIEDPYVFRFDDRYYLIAEDRTGVALGQDRDGPPGGTRPGVLYESGDGFAWHSPRVGYLTNDCYFDEPRRRFERPQLLWKGGRPQALFLALQGGRFATSSGAYLEIAG